MRIQKGYRSNRGQQLIELLFAVLISGFLAVMMGASLAQTLAASGNVENQLKAYEIGEELVDRIRRSPYSDLVPGTWPVQVYSDDGVIASGGKGFQTAPLVIDTSQYTWDPASLANRLPGPSPNHFATASVAIVATPLANNAMTCAITVNWAENTAAKTMTFTSVVSQSGIHD